MEKKSGWLAEIKNYLLGTAVALIVVLVLLEIILRVLNPTYSLQLIEEPNGAQHFLVLNEKDSARFAFFRYDSALGWKPAANATGKMMTEEYNINVNMNAEGFRDSEHAVAKQDGVRRIALLGDSFVWGWGAEKDNRSGEKLAQMNSSFEVLNFGCGGWGTTQELLAYEQYGEKYKPDDVVLLLFIDNDLDDNFYTDGKCDKPYYVLDTTQGSSLSLINDTSLTCGSCGAKSCGGGGLRDLVRSSSLTDFMLNFQVGKFALDTAKRLQLGSSGALSAHLQIYNASDAQYAKRLETTGAILKMADETAKRGGAKLHVFYFSSKSILENEWNETTVPSFASYDFYGPAKYIGGYCGRENISCTDLDPLFSGAIEAGKEPFYKKDGHTTDIGNKLVADEVYRKLVG